MKESLQSHHVWMQSPGLGVFEAPPAATVMGIQIFSPGGEDPNTTILGWAGEENSKTPGSHNLDLPFLTKFSALVQPLAPSATL